MFAYAIKKINYRGNKHAPFNTEIINIRERLLQEERLTNGSEFPDETWREGAVKLKHVSKSTSKLLPSPDSRAEHRGEASNY